MSNGRWCGRQLKPPQKPALIPPHYSRSNSQINPLREHTPRFIVKLILTLKKPINYNHYNIWQQQTPPPNFLTQLHLLSPARPLRNL